MNTYEAQIQIRPGVVVTTQVRAESYYAAQQLLESMYGPENIWTAPVLVG